MKKLILILTLTLILLPLAAEARMGAVMMGAGVAAAAPSGDSCTGNLLYSHHAENNDDATTSANGTQGCSASDTYKSWTKTSAVYDNTADTFIDGAYGIKFNGYNHRADITTTGWMDLTSKGCVSMWFKSDGAHDTNPFMIYIDATHYIGGYSYYASGNIRILYRDGTANIAQNAAAALPAAGGWIQFGWDIDSDLVQVRTCDDAACSGESWTTKTDVATIDIGDMPASFRIGSGSGASGYGWIDNVKIYASSDCTP